MRHTGLRALLVLLCSILLAAYVLPWNQWGVSTEGGFFSFAAKPYKFGLDLQGGVELDYRVDFAELEKSGVSYRPTDVVEGLKSIIEKRVNALGTAEPTIQSASYGNESHIVVQIPTEATKKNMTVAEARAAQQAYIDRAKESIGRVVRLEFREQKTEITAEDRAARRKLADDALVEIKAGKEAFDVVAKKYRDQNENLEYIAGSGALKDLPVPVAFTGIANVAAPFLSGVMDSKRETVLSVDKNGQLVQGGNDEGYSIVRITDITTETVTDTGSTASGAVASGSTASGAAKTHQEKIYHYQALYVAASPSEWQAAKTKDGKVLNDQYLSNVAVSYSQAFQPQIDLYFNDAGAKIFAELTTRLKGKQIAIFVGGELLTAPTVQETIPNGRAVITGQFTPEGAKKLANDIKTGIVPAPIYLTSERAIDAKIGSDALHVVIVAGLIGLVAIVVFLTIVYSLSGLFSGIALVVYTLILLALVKWFGVVLTLASIAGVILSIGLAIDANILIFERVKEELRAGSTRTRALAAGFERSWATIWDSHLTSLSSAIILFIFGISLIKGFGLMLGIGIVVSLFTSMYVSRLFVSVLGQSKLSDRVFVGLESQKK